MARFIEADVIQKIATEAEWLTQTRIPYKGQIMIVSDSSGRVVNMKVGDGANPFSDLNYMFDSIQQNAQYIPITSNALPTPIADPAWGMVTEGTYTFGGVDVFTVPDGHWGIANYSSGSWSFVDMGELPMQDVSGLVEKAEIVDNLTTEDPSKPLSANMGAVIKPRILPSSQEFMEVDRPDLDAALIEVDSDNKIIRIIAEADEPDISTAIGFDRPDLSVVFTDSDGKIIHKEYSGEVGDDLNKLMAIPSPVDRPDLEGSLIILDKYDKVIFQSNTTSAQDNGSDTEMSDAMQYIKRFWNPPAQEGFDVQTVIPDPENILVNYNNLIEKWDEILDRQVINPELEPYISKEEIGRSGAGNLPIYRYDFKPQNPKYKVVLNAGTHAGEKMYIQVLLNFFNHFTTEWVNDPVLEWLYRTVHFIVVPVRGPYTLGFPRKIRGSRQMPETDPIPMSWTRSGTTVTMTFDAADFPVNENLNAETYFTEVPASALVGKGSFGVITSSDEEALPLNAYKIGGVVDGKTITFEVPDDMGATSGTGTFQVWADPNRNFNPIGTNNWFNFNSTTNPQMFDVDGFSNPNGQVYGFYDGKGTKPQSLRENADFIRMIDSEAPDLVYDLHSPASDHYFSYNSMPNTDEFGIAIENMKEFSGRYSATGFSRVTGLGTITVSQSRYIASKGIPTAAIEWGGGVQWANAKGVQDAMRWLIVAVTEVIKTIK